jgi:hypothetical protein
MRVKYSVLFLNFLFYSIVTLAQDTLSANAQRIFNQFYPFTKKTVLIENRTENYTDMSAGFVIKLKQKYFLVTAYHVLSGNIAADTLLSVSSGDKKIKSILVFFHTKADSSSAITLPLYRNGKRLFISVPHEAFKFHSNREVADIAFLPLNNLRSDILIDTVSIPQKTLALEPDDSISIWGFSRGRTSGNHQCIVDFVSGLRYFGNAVYIIFKETEIMGGDSGAPCYIHNGETAAFIGMLVNSTLDHTSGVIISNILINKCIKIIGL